jgi:hypothetical protein
MREEGIGSVGTTAGGTNRYAKEGGSFSYTMEVDPEGTTLLVTFKTADSGKSIEILAGGESVFKEVLELQGDGEYVDVLIPLKKEVLQKAYGKFYNCRDRKVLDFEFRGIDGAESAAVCQFIYTLTE